MRLANYASIILLSSITSMNVVGAEEQHNGNNQFVGTWELLSVERVDAEGNWSSSIGQLANSIGVLMYDEFGHMSVHIMNLDRVPVASNGFAELSGDELRDLFRGYVAYFGTYDVNERKSYVIHHRRGHLYPNQVGVDAKRFFEFSDDKLTLTVAPSRNFRLTWQRVDG